MSLSKPEVSLHQLSEHAVVGVNWRPMRLVGEVPREHACDHCRVIPRETAMLPCEHVLCHLCRQANTSTGRLVCPIDKRSCDKEELRMMQLPETALNALKAHCWNEDKGCQFVGPVETLLRHYERDCGFRSIQCSISRERVLLKDLPVHCNGEECTATGEAAAASASSYPTRDATPSVSSITDTVEEQKRQLREIHSHVAVMQSQVEKLHEASAMRMRKAQELQRQQADRERQPKGGSLLRKFNNSLRRSFGKARKARESESVQQLAETVDSVGESSQI
ncbi:hypothetical protein HPB51_028983 [Rhipicephalus microplus]|uniref:RING-type domain-containing protein n=1 Tax=Rhipicephalus microplus TaxID=6941 RepID=A0A9J6CVU9_RHIMP|nr:TNF receptor-associated factor 3-like [Rhipicephalus microplus]KAH7934653.1 hypothetical protein HPB51_028983 [Rhipicephalus microplus]